MKQKQSDQQREQELLLWAKWYKNQPVPTSLEQKLKNIQTQTISKKQSHFAFVSAKWIGCVAAICLFFTLSVNYIPALAAVVADIPILGTMAKFVTFSAYQEDYPEAKADVNISGAKIEGLGEGELETGLNEKYAKQAHTLYEEFMEKIDAGENHIAIFSDYQLAGNNGVTVSIDHAQVDVAASGVESHTYDTIDVVNQLYLTLPSLFVDDSYVDRISQIILGEMEVRKAEGALYFDGESGFQKIAPDQQFYISDDFKLVIVFDEYSIAPGYMGMSYFEIPTEQISDLLVSDTYLR
jgi:hypothetical protein